MTCLVKTKLHLSNHFFGADGVNLSWLHPEPRQQFGSNAR